MSSEESEYDDVESSSSDEEDILIDSAQSDVEMASTGSVTDLTIDEVIDDEDVYNSKIFQKDNWRYKFLPYYEELKIEADTQFIDVKARLSKSIISRNIRPGFIAACKDLIEFIDIYHQRFSKTDHINMVKLLFEILIMKDLDFRVVRSICETLNVLLSKRMHVTRADLRIPWRPLYDLYHLVAFKKMESDGLIIFPDGLKGKLEQAIKSLHDFFEDEATQEILDVLRPNICPFSDMINRSVAIAILFLPTCLTVEQHDRFGARLWFDELYFWCSSGELGADNENLLLGLFLQLSIDCPFYIDWTNRLDWLFDRLIKSSGLFVAQVELGTDTTSVYYIAMLLAYNISGSNDIILDKLNTIFQSWEDFFYPSNSANHLNQLISFILKLITTLTTRISRERYNSKKFFVQIHPSHHITDRQIDVIVKSLLSILNYAAFAITKQDVPRLFRYMSFLAPGIILPQLLDLIYPALENMTEPHRLEQTLNIFMQTLVPLARDEVIPGRERLKLKTMDEENDKSLRIHFIRLLNNLLPGLDINDIRKSSMTFQIIATIFCLMPVVDCSDAVRIRNDLTEEESELCKATADFEFIIEQILSKCFAIIEASSSDYIGNSRPFHMENVQKNTEESLQERGVYVVIKQLCKNCSSKIFNYTMNLFFDFMRDRIFDSTTAIDSICRLCVVFITGKPKEAFPIFFNYAWNNLQALISPSSFEEEELNHGILWFYTLTCEILYNVRGDVILEHKDLILQALETLLSFKCRDAYLRACNATENVLRMLTTIYPDMDEYYMAVNDQPLDKYLPIRHWAKTVNKKEWQMKWHVPSDDEVQLAELIVHKYLFGSLHVLNDPQKLKDKEVQKFLHIAQNVLFGVSTVVPYFDGDSNDLVYMYPNNIPIPRYSCIAMPSNVRRIVAPNGENLRRVVYAEIKKLTLYILEHRKNDAKSLKVIISILNNLLLSEGIDPMSFAVKAAHYTMKKRILNDPIKGDRMILESSLEDNIYFMHQKRMFSKPLAVITNTHSDALSLLVILSTSLYSDTRKRAQQVLELCLCQVSYLYNLIIDQVLDIIRNQDRVSHEEFKGALYILANGKKTSMCLKHDWTTLLKIWPLIVRSQEYEKPSVILLFDAIIAQIIKSFETFTVGYNMPDVVLPSAIRLLKDYDGNRHKVLCSLPTEADIIESKQFENAVNQNNLRNYMALMQELFQVCNDRNLHWRHVSMAHTLITLMFRTDVPFPDEIVKYFTRLLIHDVAQTRQSALTLITSWQKLIKIKSIKQPFKRNVEIENTGIGAKWPIIYGFRKDNYQLITDMAKHPQTPEEYNSSCYFTKWNTGFYTWPEEYKVLAPLNRQDAANREINELSQIEKDVFSIVSEPEFLKTLFKLYIVEDKKGSEEFVEMNYLLFYRFFRNFGPPFVSLIQPYLDGLLKSKKESEQRFASEIVSGLIMATKLWKYERVVVVVEWLRPRLKQCLENMTDEAEINWITSLANVFVRMDLRQCQWLFDIIVDLVQKSYGNGFHTTFRFRLLLQCVLQYEWRVPHLLQDIFRHSAQLIARNSHFLRIRVGSALASCTFYDLKGIYVDPEIDPIHRPLTRADVICVINRELRDSIWNEVLTSGFDELKYIWETKFTATVPRLNLDLNNGPEPPSDTPLRKASLEESEKDGEEMDVSNRPTISLLSRTSNVGTKPRSIGKSVRRASTPPLAKMFSGVEMGRKREKAMVITLINCVSRIWMNSATLELYASFELFPVFVHFANDNTDEELRKPCEDLVIGEMACSVVDLGLAAHVLNIVKLTVLRSCTWKTRCTAIRFLQVHVFANLYVYKNGFVDRIKEILDILLLDTQIEVRTNAGLTVSGFLQCGLFEVDDDLMKKFIEWSGSPELLRRHAGIIGLSGIVTSTPYKVPSYLPDILMYLVKHLGDKPPINIMVKKILCEFRRTHLDCWKEHSSKFNERQLTILKDLMISPNYYV